MCHVTFCLVGSPILTCFTSYYSDSFFWFYEMYVWPPSNPWHWPRTTTTDKTGFHKNNEEELNMVKRF